MMLVLFCIYCLPINRNKKINSSPSLRSTTKTRVYSKMLVLPYIYCLPINAKSMFVQCETHHIVLQSKLTSIHLLGFMLKDWANSTPFIKGRNSGQMKALPA